MKIKCILYRITYVLTNKLISLSLNVNKFSVDDIRNILIIILNVMVNSNSRYNDKYYVK